MVFLWFSYGFPMVFLWFSYGFPMVFLWFSYGFWGMSSPSSHLFNSFVSCSASSRATSCTRSGIRGCDFSAADAGVAVGSMAPLLGWNERRVNGWVSGGDIILVIHIYICVCMYYIDIFISWYIYIMIYLYHDISRYIATTKKRQKKVIWWYIWYFFFVWDVSCSIFLSVVRIQRCLLRWHLDAYNLQVLLHPPQRTVWFCSRDHQKIVAFILDAYIYLILYQLSHTYVYIYIKHSIMSDLYWIYCLSC